MRGVLIAARGFFEATRSNCDAARRVATKTIHFALVVVVGGGIFALRRPENDAARHVATSFGERENQI